MSDPVITVKGLSKRYRLGIRETADTFAGQLKNTLTYPVRNLKRITRLGNFKDQEDETIFWALKDINFEVQRGEVLGIIGHNGAGKSTLLKILSKITPPTTGEISIRGRVSSLLEVGTGFHPELSGRDNVYMNGTILGMSRKEIDAKFDAIVDFAGVSKHIDTPVKFYSSGMKVRLGFSVAAHLEPEILIIDEVLAVGDAEFQRKCLGKMEDVAGEGRTVLFVSHNMNAVKSLCPKAILLKNGEMIFEGNSDQVVDYYLSANSLGTSFYQFHDDGFLEDDGISLGSVKVLSEFGENSTQFPMDHALKAQVEFEFLRNPETNYGFTLQFKNDKGEVLFVSAPQEFDFSTFSKGKHLLQCNIPSPFFNEGSFSVNLHVVRKGSQRKVVKRFEDVIAFNIGPPKADLGDWMGKSKGWLKPEFKWSSVKTSEDSI